MSSLVETSSNDDSQVSNVATMSGRPLNRNAVPKRPWNGYSLVNFTNSNGEPLTASPRLIRAPKSRTKAALKQANQPATGERAQQAPAAVATTSTTTTGVLPGEGSRGAYANELGIQKALDGRVMSTKEDHDGLQEFIHLLAANRSNYNHTTTPTTTTTTTATTTSNANSGDEHAHETEEEGEEENEEDDDDDDDDTSNPHIDDLITIMKAHKVMGDQVQIPQDYDYQDILPSNPPFRFTFESKQSAHSDAIPAQPQHQTPQQPSSPSQPSPQDAGFHFSFPASSSSSSAEPYDLVRKLTQRNSIASDISHGIARHPRPVPESSSVGGPGVNNPPPHPDPHSKQSTAASHSPSSSCPSSPSSSSSSYLAHPNDDTTQPICTTTTAISTSTTSAAATAATSAQRQDAERGDDDDDDDDYASVDDLHHHRLDSQYIASQQHAMMHSAQRPLSSHSATTSTPSIPADDRPRFVQVQHRKILPLPKPRWKRKDIRISAGDVHSSATVPHANLFGMSPDKVPPFAPYMWQFSPPARELHGQQHQQQQRQAFPPDPMADMDWGMHQLSLANDDTSTTTASVTATTATTTTAPHTTTAPNHALPTTTAATSSSSSITTPNTTTPKRTQRADDPRRDGVDDRPHLPEGSFDFSLNSDDYEKLQHLPKVEDLQRSQPSLDLTHVLRDSMLPTRQEAVSLAAAAATANMFATMPPPPPPPPEDTQPQLPSTSHAKKKGSGEEKAPSRKTKKTHRKKKVAEEDHGPGAVHTSDLSLIRSPDPEEWICIFCQYQIFCRGFEMARRKGGYYRRRRERQRRLREVEARRTGETLSGEVASEGEDLDPAAMPVASPLPSTAASASIPTSASAAAAAAATAAAAASGGPHVGSSSAAAAAAAAAAGMDSSRGVRRGNHAA